MWCIPLYLMNTFKLYKATCAVLITYNITTNIMIKFSLQPQSPPNYYHTYHDTILSPSLIFWFKPLAKLKLNIPPSKNSSLHKKWSFPFIEEILNGKLHFLCNGWKIDLLHHANECLLCNTITALASMLWNNLNPLIQFILLVFL